MVNAKPIVHQTGGRANWLKLPFGKFGFACLFRGERMSGLSGRCQQIGDQKFANDRHPKNEAGRENR